MLNFKFIWKSIYTQLAEGPGVTSGKIKLVRWKNIEFFKPMTPSDHPCVHNKISTQSVQLCATYIYIYIYRNVLFYYIDRVSTNAELNSKNVARSFWKTSKIKRCRAENQSKFSIFGKRVIFECFPTISQSVFQIFQKVPNSNGFQVPRQFLLKKLRKNYFSAM